MRNHVPWWRLEKKKPKQKTGRPKLFETAKARNHKDLDASLDAAIAKAKAGQ